MLGTEHVFVLVLHQIFKINTGLDYMKIRSRLVYCGMTLLKRFLHFYLDIYLMNIHGVVRIVYFLR